MDTISRRSALAAGAALALAACSEEAVPPTDIALDYPEYAPRLAEIAEEERAVATWIEEHRDALPTSYDELVQLPSAYRVPVVLGLPPALASAIMQEHLRRAAGPEMTAEQREVIANVREFLTPAWFTSERQARVMACHRAFGERIASEFTVAENIRVFEAIGPEDDWVRRRIVDAGG